MYNISKLSPVSRSFSQSLMLLTKGNQEMTSMALAKVIANLLPIPSSQVEDLPAAFLTLVYAQSREMVGTINEITVLDINRVEALVQLFWTARYNIVYPRKKLYQIAGKLTEASFFGYGSIISPADLEFISLNAKDLIALHNGFAQMFIELTDEASGEPAPMVVGLVQR